MKVLFADKIIEKAVDIINKEEGMEADLKPGLSEEELIAIIPDYDALIVRSGVKVNRAIIDAASRLKVIGRAGVGTDNIDKEYAKEKGIAVMNTPFGNIYAAAEHTITLMMLLAKHVIHAHHSLKRGEWERKKYVGIEVKGKTLAIIGMGKIGQLIANVARSLGMTIVSYDPYLTEEKAKELGIEKLELDDLLAKADFITVHVPLTDETRNLLSREEFAKMKDGVRILNVARGGVINEDDLYDAIKSGKVAAAAIDVWTEEPPTNSKLLELEEVIATPHLGASTIEAQENVGLDIAHQVIDALKKGVLANVVNGIERIR